MSWGTVAAAAATVVGSSLSANASKDAAAIAAGGADQEVWFNRESRDIANAYQKPYREAGYTALDALMSMTGLSSPAGGPGARLSSSDIAAQAGGNTLITPNDPTGFNSLGSSRYIGSRASGYAPLHQRYAGGAINAGMNYNVNEMGPENIYRNGSYTRGHGPSTIDGSTGYVEPHTQGRNEGGFLGGTYDPGPINDGGPGTWQTSGPPQNVANSTAINPTTGFPTENPGGVEGGYNFMTDPGYQFRFEEGQRAIDRSASAAGHSLSGGAVRKAIRYGQGMASAEYGNVYNRISNIAGLGQTANQASGNAALIAGGRMGNAASAGANASAYGQVGAGNAWANAGNELSRLPWDNVFGGNKNNNDEGYPDGGWG